MKKNTKKQLSPRILGDNLYRIQEWLSEIKVSAECIVEDTLDAKEVLNFLIEKDKEGIVDINKLITDEIIAKIRRYQRRIDALYDEGIPVFNNYVVQRDYNGEVLEIETLEEM